MKNRSFMLLALLAANDRLGEPPVHRTMLVKQAFLAETIRPLYQLWVRTFGFVRYYYGPYSDEIFQRLDTLIFNGLVRVTMMERIGGKVEARYQITGSGHRALRQFRESEFVQLAVDLVWALQALGVEQAGTICRLVYQEAEFARVFAEHSEQNLPPSAKVPLPAITETGNQTFATLAILQELQSRPWEHTDTKPQLPAREMVRLFLLSLARQIPTTHSVGRSAR
jgi:DNA-binding PadR family transcriptional regulator